MGRKLVGIIIILFGVLVLAGIVYYVFFNQYSASDITAYDYALRARELRKNWNDVSDLENVLQLLEQSVELDPNFAYGYTMIGIVLHFDMRNVGVPTQIWIDEALHMAEISINLDSTLPEAYLLRSYAIKSKFGKSKAVYDDLWKAYELDGRAVLEQPSGSRPLEQPP